MGFSEGSRVRNLLGKRAFLFGKPLTSYVRAHAANLTPQEGAPKTQHGRRTRCAARKITGFQQLVMKRRRINFFSKLVISSALLFWLGAKVWNRQEQGELLERLSTIAWPWLLLAGAMQLLAVACSVVRWDRLLAGQGIHAPWRHLGGSFMIGRFFGAFTPGGWTGLNGYRIYDISRHTKKTARAVTSIGVEMVLGQLAFGAVVILGSIYGVKYIGLQGVLLVDGFFLFLIALAIVLLSKPLWFRTIANRLPGPIRRKTHALVEAVCAYNGKSKLLIQAALLGVGTHFFNALIYVSSARALGLELGMGDVFFVSAMQIFATLVPASINGIGLREATAVALYGRVGISVGEAALIPIVGFTVEMVVSAIGGIILLLRPADYAPRIRVEDADREEALLQTEAPKQMDASATFANQPRPFAALCMGASAGLLAGILVGVAEALVVNLSSHGAIDYSTFAYGSVSYGLLCALLGAGAAFTVALLGRVWPREAVRPSLAFAHLTALIVAAFAFALGAFRMRRDVFHELFAWKSGQGLLLLVGCLLVAALLYAALAYGLTRALGKRADPWLIQPRGLLLPLAVVALIAMVSFGLARGGPSDADFAAQLRSAPSNKLEQAASGAATIPSTRPPTVPRPKHVLLLVVDTLRADHLPMYGYENTRTPNLEKLAGDGIVFERAYANASWTRPSYASILTGRFASSHRTMSKADALPGEVVTLGEAFSEAGYKTAAVVTNYNIASFFNFAQGFDVYNYLEPEFVLGAGDMAAKLLLVQSLRRGVETWRAKRGVVTRGSAYRDAEEVNATVTKRLEAMGQKPWFAMVGYMDPHDPYYAHPYSGQGYARAAHQHPAPEEADALRALYDGEINYWDRELGTLIRFLKERQLYDDTLIVVTSDHGEEFADHGGFWHGTTLYEEQIHVPLIVKLPGNQQAESRVAHWVQHVDLMPSMLRLAGVAVPQGTQGGDLFHGSQKVFAEESHEGNVLRSVHTQHEGGGSVKLIVANPNNPRGLEPVELYRLESDPQEQDNLHGQTPALASAQDALKDAARRAAHGAAEARQVDLADDPATIERLRKLGYVE